MRTDALRLRPCEWCGVEFRAKRHRGVERRFHTRTCFLAAKKALGTVRPAGVSAEAPHARRLMVLTGHRVLHVRAERSDV